MITLVITTLLTITLIEVFLHFLIRILKNRFDNLITKSDEVPRLDLKKLESFLEKGYDPELGWVRKPLTSKTEPSFSGEKSYHINSYGSRINPGNENRKTKILTLGDSYTFCREVNDDETWQYFLAKMAKTNVANFGVGNYGLDQAFLRFKREIKNFNEAKIVIIGVVPATLLRNLCLWKHYSEFGNTFAFKPRFILYKDNLKLIKNPAYKKEFFMILKKSFQSPKNMIIFILNLKKGRLIFLTQFLS